MLGYGNNFTKFALWRFLKILDLEEQFDPSIPHLVFFPEELKAPYHSDICAYPYLYRWEHMSLSVK